MSVPPAEPRQAEAELLAKAKAGDFQAFADLCEPCRQAVCSYLAGAGLADPADAEDVFMDAILRARRALDAFQSGSAFSTWLTSIARNLALDRLREAAAHPLSSLDEPPPPPPPPPPPLHFSRRDPTPFRCPSGQRNLLHFMVLPSTIPSSFPRQHPDLFFYYPGLRPPLLHRRGILFFRNFQKYGSTPKSHAALQLSVVKQLPESILSPVFPPPYRMAKFEHGKV